MYLSQCDNTISQINTVIIEEDIDIYFQSTDDTHYIGNGLEGNYLSESKEKRMDMMLVFSKVNRIGMLLLRKNFKG